MNPRPRGRYKKKQHNLILYIKITLIGYLAIFGVGYMSSDTSAYLSSQSVITGTITADIWEVPEVLACDEEGLIDKVPGEESEPNAEGKADQSQGETSISGITFTENEMDCANQEDESHIIDETGNPNELECKKIKVPVSDVSVTDVVPVTNEKVISDCKKEEDKKDTEKATEDVETPAIDKENEEKEKEKATEEAEAPASDKENETPNQSELTTGEKEAEKDSGTKEDSGEGKENEGQKTNNESLPQSSGSPEITNDTNEGSPLLKL